MQLLSHINTKRDYILTLFIHFNRVILFLHFIKHYNTFNFVFINNSWFFCFYVHWATRKKSSFNALFLEVIRTLFLFPIAFTNTKKHTYLLLIYFIKNNRKSAFSNLKRQCQVDRQTTERQTYGRPSVRFFLIVLWLRNGPYRKSYVFSIHLFIECNNESVEWSILESYYCLLKSEMTTWILI